MDEAVGKRLIFGRYSREDCGLPPVGERGWRPARTVLRGLVLIAVLIVCGWLAGNATARWRDGWVRTLPGRLALDPDGAQEMLARGRMYARALPYRDPMRYGLALALAVEAERAPRRMGYYGNAAALLRRAEGRGMTADAESRFHYGLAASGIFAENGDYRRALAELDGAVAAYEENDGAAGLPPSLRLLWINARAYYLAKSGLDPERALDLASLMIASRDELPGGGHASGSAALLDTLAVARYAAGDMAGARDCQRLALGLADGRNLDTYLAHYDLFRAGPDKE